MLGKQTKDGIFACWGSRLKRVYLLVGKADLRGNICLLGKQTKEGIFAYWGSRVKREYLLIGQAD